MQAMNLFIDKLIFLPFSSIRIKGKLQEHLMKIIFPISRTLGHRMTFSLKHTYTFTLIKLRVTIFWHFILISLTACENKKQIQFSTKTLFFLFVIFVSLPVHLLHASIFFCSFFLAELRIEKSEKI